MRAVNLIPADHRRFGRSGSGQSGGGAYVVVGGLVGLLVMSGLLAVARRQTADRKAKLAAVSREADSATARASALSPYAAFATLRAQRVQAISAVATQRVNWALAIREIVSALPSDVHLLTLSNIAPTSSAGAAPPTAATAGAPVVPGAATPAAAAGPSFDVSGCASTQTQVADVINLLRGIPGGPQVSLSSSAKSATAAAGTSSPGGCGNASTNPQFDVTVAFPTLPGASAAAASSAAPGSAGGAAAPTGAGGAATGTPGAATPGSGATATGPTTTPTTGTPTTGSSTTPTSPAPRSTTGTATTSTATTSTATTGTATTGTAATGTAATGTATTRTATTPSAPAAVTAPPLVALVASTSAVALQSWPKLTPTPSVAAGRSVPAPVVPPGTATGATPR